MAATRACSLCAWRARRASSSIAGVHIAEQGNGYRRSPYLECPPFAHCLGSLDCPSDAFSLPPPILGTPSRTRNASVDGVVDDRYFDGPALGACHLQG